MDGQAQVGDQQAGEKLFEAGLIVVETKMVLNDLPKRLGGNIASNVLPEVVVRLQQPFH